MHVVHTGICGAHGFVAFGCLRDHCLQLELGGAWCGACHARPWPLLVLRVPPRLEAEQEQGLQPALFLEPRSYYSLPLRRAVMVMVMLPSLVLVLVPPLPLLLVREAAMVQLLLVMRVVVVMAPDQEPT